MCGCDSYWVKPSISDTFPTWVDSQGNKETLSKKNASHVSGREIKWSWDGYLRLDGQERHQLLSPTVMEGPTESRLLSFIPCGSELRGLCETMVAMQGSPRWVLDLAGCQLEQWEWYMNRMEGQCGWKPIWG